MLELVEIQGVARQGMTKPVICRGDDGKTYYAKGKDATASGLIKEWMAANLAQALGLPIPNFHIATIDSFLVESARDLAYSLGSGNIFISEKVQAATEFKYSLLEQVSEKIQRDILLFDLWVENSDRTLTKYGGNPNLLWQSVESKLYIIDHNLAFDHDFNLSLLRETHIFQSQFSHFQLDLIAKQQLEAKLKYSLENWQKWWNEIPDTWKQENTGLVPFNPDITLQRLKDEANGALWRKYL